MADRHDLSNSGIGTMTRDFRIPILTYHSIDMSGSVISTSPEIFRKQIESLSRAGYTTIRMGEIASSIAQNKALPTNSLVLTFDDGFQNFYTHAFPVLSEHGFCATVFLVTDFCGKHNDWSGNPAAFPRSELLSWKQIRELSETGIEFGSHTKTHRDLTRLTQGEAEAEIVGSKAAIENNLGHSIGSFAYPFGQCNHAAKEITAAQFDSACSTILGKVSPQSDRYSLNRIDAYYLSDQRVIDKLPSTLFDNYMRFRQTLRTVRSFVSGR